MKILNLKFLTIWFRYYFSKYSRYRHIYWIIINLRPKSILEVGVYKGKRSNEMINLTKDFTKSLSYYGFDLFEKIQMSKINLELSKQPLSRTQLQKKLLNNFKDVKINLIQGDTKKTLKNFSKKKKKIDFVFIDGGHSIQTIQSDWNNVKNFISEKSVVIFDDYYDDKNIIKKFGCNKIIEKLESKYKYEILPSNDYIKFQNKMIKNSLVKVTYKKN